MTTRAFDRAFVMALLAAVLSWGVWTATASALQDGAEKPPAETSGAAAGRTVSQPAPGADAFAAVRLEAAKAERLVPEINKLLKDDGRKIARPDISLEALGKVRDELDKARLRILQRQRELSAALDAVGQQLKALGPQPRKGEKEDPAIAAQRKMLQAMRGRLNAAGQMLALLATKTAQLAQKAAAKQREKFLSSVFESSRSVLNPLLWAQGAAEVPGFFLRLKVLLSKWSAGGEGDSRVFLAVLALFALSSGMLIHVWRRWRRPPPANVELDDLHRLWRAIRVAVYSAFVVFATLLVLNVAIYALSTPSPRVARFLDAVAMAILYASVMVALARGVFRPATPYMRLVNLSSADALRAYRISAAIAGLYALDSLMGELAEILFMPVDFSAAWSALTSMLYAILFVLLLTAIRQASPLSGGGGDDAEDMGSQRFFFGWTRYVFHLLWLVILAVFAALALGYISLAHFITTRLVATAAVITALYLLHHLADAAVRAALDRNTYTGQFLRRAMSLPEHAITQLGVLFSTLVDISVMAAGLPLVLMMWAVNWVDMTNWARAAFFGFKVGNITIEPSSILLGVLVLIIGLILSRLLTLWLEKRVLDRTNLDSGVRHSIVTTAKYTLTIGAFLVALSVAGVNFSSLAILGGALGIGIGFGLQSIVNNFVSGLILLAERPIKVGDWIKVKGGEGVVRKIKVRSTEIETFDRCSVIVPNSSLISEPVSNWYHNSRMGRLRLLIGVSYDADPDEVEKILMRCAVSHPRALANPKPFVLFQGFGDNSLDFELRVYVDDAGYITRTGSDLRFAIFRALKAADIEIPFPQRDVHIRSMPDEIFDRGGMPPEPPESRS